MIITRTPFRISFFGGGSDFPAWYKENRGAVLSTTIDKYCYISCRELPPFFEYKHRIVYSKIENIKEINEIVHPAVRETLRFMNIEKGLEIHHDGDLPARSGLGSSSAFTVGLLHTFYAFKGNMVSKKQLSLEAIHIEQDMIKENVGSQDQVIVAYGGLNKIVFSGDHNIEVAPVPMSSSKSKELQSHLMLFFTGFTRFATDIEGEKINQIKKKEYEIKTMTEMVDEAINILNGESEITQFGKMLHESWKLKKSLSDKVTTSAIDKIYETGLKNGALGGKILGAGGGGFILFFVEPDNKEKLKKSLSPLLHVPFCFDSLGSQIIYYNEGGL
ncbi:kinase [Candidatus Desantisbacteria bacterium]|nr:kinase [Candidatus Desantisbacteria bacterium]